MAFLERDESSGRFRIRFRYAGRAFKRSIKVKDPREAEGIRGRVEETLVLLERGRLEIPAGADPGRFILSDGKLTAKPVLAAVLTVEGLFALYEREFTQQAKEANTRRVERIHAGHITRLLGAKKQLPGVTAADIQAYVDRRTQEKWRGRSVKPQTVKKELDTFRAVWNWAVNKGEINLPFPGMRLTYPKGREREPFRTYDEIAAIVARGGLSPKDAREHWDCLFLSPQEVGEVLDHVRANTTTLWLYPLVVFAAHTGARKSELRRVRVADLDLARGSVLIREKKKDKSRETFRRVEMSSLLTITLRDYLAAKHPGGEFLFCRTQNVPLLDTTVHEAFRWALRGGRWKVLRGLHAFRHSFASNLAAAGIDQRVIDELLGHQTEEMRRRYRHLFPEQRRRAVDSEAIRSARLLVMPPCDPSTYSHVLRLAPGRRSVLAA